MDLLSPYALTELSKVLTFGAKKYSEHNWRGGIKLSRLIAAAMRHLNAFNAGKNKDRESKLSHAAHLMCCAMFMLWTCKHRPDLDDRWKETKKSHSRVRSGK